MVTTFLRRSSRRLTILLAAFAVAISSLLVHAGPAAADTKCSDDWRTIEASELGSMVTFHGTAPTANGTPGVETWNQQVFFCRDSAWGTGHYGIYTNPTKRYCGAYGTDTTLQCHNSTINKDYSLFEIKRYDSRFWTIKHVGKDLWVTADSSYNRRLYLRNWLGGANLFELSGL